MCKPPFLSFLILKLDYSVGIFFHTLKFLFWIGVSLINNVVVR